MITRRGDPAEYLETAIQHLEIIDGDTDVRAMRIHCHFALMFLQLVAQHRSMSTPTQRSAIDRAPGHREPGPGDAWHASGSG